MAIPTELAGQARQFLSELFSDLPEDDGFCVFTIPGRRGRRFKSSDLDAAVTFATQSSVENVYVETSFGKLALGDKRIRAAESHGIVGLWIDFDIAGEGHQAAKSYAPNQQAVHDAIDRLPLAPTLVIDSGHGIQAWWLFNEPLEFTSPEEHASGADLALRWTSTVRKETERDGWTIDSTGDLARLMRLPGTMNVKNPNDPVPVVYTTWGSGQRYNPEDFEGYLVEPDYQMPGIALVDKNLVFDPDANPPFAKFDVAMANDAKFKKTWERKRKDLGRDLGDGRVGDQSPSVYDMSLVAQAVGYGWTDQEIVDLIIAHRRKYGDPLKLDSAGRIRADYFHTAISKARAKSKLQESAQDAQTAVRSGDPEALSAVREEVLSVVSAQLGVNITKVVRYAGEKPVYELWIDNQGAMVGDSGAMMSQSRVRQAIVDASPYAYATKVKEFIWDDICRSLLSIAEIADMGEEQTSAGLVESWLQDYLDRFSPSDDIPAAVLARRPFIVNQQATYVFMDHLKNWLFAKRMENVAQRDLSVALKRYGAVPQKYNVLMPDGKRTTRYVWLLPDKTPVAAPQQAVGATP